MKLRWSTAVSLFTTTSFLLNKNLVRCRFTASDNFKRGKMKLILETERLVLRPMTVADAEHIFSTWASDPRVTKYMIYPTHENVRVTKNWLAEVEKSQELNLGFELKSTGKLIGSGGAYHKADKNAYSIGYNIAYDYWGKGYATEAMTAIVQYLIKEKGAKHFISEHADDNPASGRVMEKLGLKYFADGSYTKSNGQVFQSKLYKMDLE